MDEPEATNAASEQQPETTAPPREPSQFAVAMQIADRLGETEEQARQQFVRTVRTLGRTQSLALLEETLQVEAAGGLMLPDGSRRRTAGGVFFFLARTKGQPKERPWLKTNKRRERHAGAGPSPASASPTPPAPAVPPFTWVDRIAAIDAIGEMRGAANVKISVIGRPGKVVDKGTCIVTVMEASKVPSLPKGLPSPPPVSTTYTVYIAAKQWRKVEDAIADPEDVLIIEGFPQLDIATSSIAVFATNTTTKKLQAAQRQAPAKGETT